MIVEESILDEANVKDILKSFIGKQKQIPPIYSAIKVKGKKLYEYARKGQEVEIEPREIEIYDIKLESIDKIKRQIQFRVKCSKGTYIRSLCEDIAVRLGNIGYMKELNRVSVGDFNIKNSIKIQDFEEQIKNKNYSSIITIEQMFEKNRKITLCNDEELKKYLNGVLININSIENKEDICTVYCNEKFIGLGTIQNNKLKRELVV